MSEFYRKTAQLLRLGMPLVEAVGCSRPDLAQRLARGDSAAQVLGLEHENDDLPTQLEAHARARQLEQARRSALKLELFYPLLILALWSLLAAWLGSWQMIAGVSLALAPLFWLRPLPPWREQASFLSWIELLLTQGHSLPTAARLALDRAQLKRWRSAALAVCQRLERGDTLERAFAPDPLAPLLKQPGAAGRVAALLERRADWGWTWMLAWLEPVLLVALGGLVALLWWH
ncbi:MAG: hypothetical protein KC910_32735, partial [Candidatus Eremiobacteraeota bacterium]|nr:hypothetical protein [Candidatus Eremiobacteraeota bacterium]